MQDTYLKSDITNDELTRAFTYISIWYNLNALKEVPREVLKRFLAINPRIIIFKWQFKELYTRIKWKYKFINRAFKEIKEGYKKLGQ